MKSSINDLKRNLLFLIVFASTASAQQANPAELLDNIIEQVLNFGPKLAVLGLFVSAYFYFFGSDEGKERMKKVAIGCFIFATAGGIVDLLMGS